MKTKADFRVLMKERIAQLSSKEKQNQSEYLCRRLLHSPKHQDATTVGIYLALPDEPDLRPAVTRLLEQGCRVALPFQIDGDSWHFREIQTVTPESSGPWDLDVPPEGPPVAASDLELILVPGRGFTLQGDRLGRGKGIYDRLLTNTKAKKIGLCFSCQIVESLPVEDHDIRMDEVWTA